MLTFFFFSPTAIEWLATITSQRAELENARYQMEALLEEVREDVFKQFQEKQGEWKPLRPYTVDKKAGDGSDPRILHETNYGEGLTLRDAYKESGHVTGEGVLIYTYPKEKPYAREHQEGATIDAPTPRRKRSRGMARYGADMDKRIEGIFRRG